MNEEAKKGGAPADFAGGFLDRFLDTLDEFVVLLDKDRRVVWANRAALLQFKRGFEEALGRPAGEMLGCLHSEEAGCGNSSWCPCGLSARIEDAQTCSADVMRETISLPIRVGETVEVRNIQVKALPVDPECAGLPRVCLIIHDRTQLVRRTDEVGILTDKLERRAMQCESMTETIMHDIKTPLLNIIAALSDVSSEDAGRDTLFEIGNLRLAVENLLRVSQIDTEGFPLAKETIDPLEVVTETIDLIRNESLPETASVDLDPPFAPIPHVSADRKVLGMVIENLVRNLIADPGCENSVRISLDTAGQSLVRISVTGAGNPIPEDLLGSIFDPEFHLKRPDSGGRRNKGLPFCKLAMVAQGGDVTADLSSGGNISFRLMLPVRRKSTAKA